jgi:ABC-type glycerol-3-phosphate transport system substrate-binding protein
VPVVSCHGGQTLDFDLSVEVTAKLSGYAAAPIAVTPNGSHWPWSWAFGMPAKAKNPAGAKKFVEWATSKDYINLTFSTQ